MTVIQGANSVADPFWLIVTSNLIRPAKARTISQMTGYDLMKLAVTVGQYKLFRGQTQKLTATSWIDLRYDESIDYQKLQSCV